MKTNLVRAALVCAVLAFTSTAATAGGDPIPGVDVVVHAHHGGSLMVQKKTNPTPTKPPIDLEGGKLKQNPQYETVKPMRGGHGALEGYALAKPLLDDLKAVPKKVTPVSTQTKMSAGTTKADCTKKGGSFTGNGRCEWHYRSSEIDDDSAVHPKPKGTK